MFDLIQTQQLLQEKQNLLLCFEEVTQNMLHCPTEELESQVQERQQIVHLVDALDEKLCALCKDTPQGQAVLQALKGQCEPDELPEEVLGIYDDAMRVRAILSRLQESDIQAALRLRVEQERILDQIKATNQGLTAKAARFYSVADQRETPTKFGHA